MGSGGSDCSLFRLHPVGVIGYGIAWPVWQHGLKNADYLFPEDEVEVEVPVDPGAAAGGKAKDERPMLVRRGFRWINEVPFGR